jgi:hypothetical protein
VRRAYGILPWGIIALGMLHMAATPSRFETLTPSAFWFFGGGFPLLFTGALNLLNRAYGAMAPGLRWVCRATNVAILAFASVGGLVTGASAAELAVVLGLMGTLTILSWTRLPAGEAHGQP